MLVLIKLIIPPTLTSPASITSEIPELAQKVVSVQFNPSTEQVMPEPAESVLTAPLSPEITFTNPVAESAQLTVPEGVVIPTEPEVILEAVPSSVQFHWKAYSFLVWLAGMVFL